MMYFYPFATYTLVDGTSLAIVLRAGLSSEKSQLVVLASTDFASNAWCWACKIRAAAAAFACELKGTRDDDF
jgi:hypothetical protein